jgi:hypothetical protein
MKYEYFDVDSGKHLYKYNSFKPKLIYSPENDNFIFFH